MMVQRSGTLPWPPLLRYERVVPTGHFETAAGGGASSGALRKALRKALPVTPELKRACVYEANNLGLRCIMAPYEADG